MKKKLIAGLAATAILAGGYLGFGTKVVPNRLVEETNTPAMSTKYADAIKDTSMKEIEARVADKKIREQTKRETMNRIEDIVGEGKFETKILEAPGLLSLDRWDPSAYTLGVSFEGEHVASYSVEKDDGGEWVLDEESLVVNEDAKLFEDIKDTATKEALKGHFVKYSPLIVAGGIITLMGAGAYMARRRRKRRA